MAKLDQLLNAVFEFTGPPILARLSLAQRSLLIYHETVVLRGEGIEIGAGARLGSVRGDRITKSACAASRTLAPAAFGL